MTSRKTMIERAEHVFLFRDHHALGGVFVILADELDSGPGSSGPKRTTPLRLPGMTFSIFSAWLSNSSGVGVIVDRR